MVEAAENKMFLQEVKDPQLQKVFQFLSDVGIRYGFKALKEDGFLPGLRLENGQLLIDLYKLNYPGDVLHEAGHLAVMCSADRAVATGKLDAAHVQKSGAEEMMAILWSYAACTFLEISPDFVFHEYGYKGASEWYLGQFESMSYIGLPGLQWIGLCYDQKQAALHQAQPFPHMIKWLRD